MREGLLWFDSDKRRTQQEKLDQAAERFLERFGHRPNRCHVNTAEAFVHPSIRVVPDSAVMKNHFWLGRDVERSALQRRRAKIA